jgi:dTDP-glucose 4,6-dehydratase
MVKTVLISGICGFVAFHLFEHILKNTDWNIVGLDKLDRYAYPQRTENFLYAHPEWVDRYKFVLFDLRNEIPSKVGEYIGDIDIIYHLAASSHVDDSIKDPLGYTKDNIVGTVNLLNYARTLPNLEHLHHFSTDETYGNAKDGQSFKETDRYLPRNPYAAAKAGSDELAYS